MNKSASELDFEELFKHSIVPDITDKDIKLSGIRSVGAVGAEGAGVFADSDGLFSVEDDVCSGDLAFPFRNRVRPLSLSYFKSVFNTYCVRLSTT